MKSELAPYRQLIDSIKGRIRQDQARSILSANISRGHNILLMENIGHNL